MGTTRVYFITVSFSDSIKIPSLRRSSSKKRNSSWPILPSWTKEQFQPWQIQRSQNRGKYYVRPKLYFMSESNGNICKRKIQWFWRGMETYLDWHVTADWAWEGCLWVSFTQHHATALDGTKTFPNHADDWTRDHVVNEVLEEWLLLQISVVLFHMCTAWKLDVTKMSLDVMWHESHDCHKIFAHLERTSSKQQVWSHVLQIFWRSCRSNHVGHRLAW